MTSLHVICGLGPPQSKILATPMSAVIQIALLTPSKIKHFGVLEKLFLKNASISNVVNTSAKLTMYVVFVQRAGLPKKAS